MKPSPLRCSKAEMDADGVIAFHCDDERQSLVGKIQNLCVSFFFCATFAQVDNLLPLSDRPNIGSGSDHQVASRSMRLNCTGW